MHFVSKKERARENNTRHIHRENTERERVMRDRETARKSEQKDDERVI